MTTLRVARIPNTVRVPRTVAAGVALALGTAVISGFSVFINGLVIKEFADPLLLTGIRNAFVGLAFLSLLAATRPGPELVALRGRQWLGLLAIAILGGSLAFFLFFGGLAAAGAPGAAFIHKTLFVWVAIMAVPFLRESLGWLQIGALGALLLGSALLTPPTGLAGGTGEAMILGATLLWSLEVVVARRLLPGISVRVAATARMAVGAAIMVALLAIDGRLAGLAAFSLQQWLIVAGTGVLLFGYVATWYGALQRAPATVVTSILVLGAVITGALQALRTGTVGAPQGIGLVVILAAVLAIAWLATRRPIEREGADARSTA